MGMRDQTRLLLELQNQAIKEPGKRPDAVLNRVALELKAW
jgi:hypothetical protein